MNAEGEMDHVNRREVETHFDVDEPARRKLRWTTAGMRCCMTELCLPDNIVDSGVNEVASRKALKRWLMNLDNQFRTSTRTGGLKSFVRNDGIRVLLQQDAFNLLPDTEWGRV